MFYWGQKSLLCNRKRGFKGKESDDQILVYVTKK